MKTGWTCRRKEERHALGKQAIYIRRQAEGQAVYYKLFLF
jgi:hypothetical protein